jgi:hypothetical protein
MAKVEKTTYHQGFNNSKYIVKYKEFDNGYGKTSDWNPNRPFKIGEDIQVSVYSEKRPGEVGKVSVPKKLPNNKKSNEYLFLTFKDGKTEYFHLNDIVPNIN